MRPLRLELEGFTAFRERTEIDFSDTDLFALWGPTGAGKSSVIDAMIFALYGAVPRLDQRAVAPVISQGKVQARVRLDFAVGSETYVATRVVQRTKGGGATTKEARLERHRPGAETEVLAGAAPEVSAEVERLLGLTFDHFTRSVVLPQGEFAAFLLDKPKDRQELLVKLLDLGVYAEMGNRARERAQVAKAQRDTKVERLSELAFATDTALAEAEVMIGRIAEAQRRIAEGAAATDRLRREAEAAGKLAENVARDAALVEAVSMPEGIDELSVRHTQVCADVEAAAEDERRAQDVRSKAEDRRKELPERAEIEALLDRHTVLADDREKAVKSQAELDAACSATKEARSVHRTAETALSTAETERERMQRRHLAHTVAADLRVGDPCPVCEQDVHELPQRVPPPALTEAEAAVERARAELDSAAAVLQSAEKQQTRIEGQLEQLRAQIDKCAAELAGKSGAEDCKELLEQIDAAETHLADATKKLEEARRIRTDLQEERDGLDKTLKQAQVEFDRSRDKVAALDPPVPSRTDPASDWSALAAWAADLAPKLEQERRDAQATARDCAEQSKRTDDALVELARDLGVAAGSLEEAQSGVDNLLADAKAERIRIADAMEEAAKLRSEEKELAEKHRVAHELGVHLKANNFEKWLLDAALRRLVDGASTRLEELSSGAYSLAVDEQGSGFDVVDHRNADETRSARTLSGGETFLASLALALALGEHIAGMAAHGSARLESLFLDEGFGTLDPETLEVVAGAIEELGARGRVVGLVTHVRELAERVPVRFEVTREPAGSTVKRVDT